MHQATIYDFLDSFDVVCPECDKRALVQPLENEQVRFSCTACGASKTWCWSESKWVYSYSSSTDQDRSGCIVLGEAFDPYFRIKLWYSTQFRQHELWAYNQKHIQFLSEVVESTDRSLNSSPETGFSNKALINRLPKWMLSQKNREDILRKLTQLDKKA